jgi:hypothetical protein
MGNSFVEIFPKGSVGGGFTQPGYLLHSREAFKTLRRPFFKESLDAGLIPCLEHVCSPKHRNHTFH